MGKIFSLPSPEKDEVLNYFFLSDIHSLHCDPEAVKVAFKFIGLVPIKQRRLIIGGDLLDIGFIYKTNDKYLKALKDHDWDFYFLPEMDLEIAWWETFYEKIEKLFPIGEIYYLLGNHEGRLTRPGFIDNVPENYKHNFDIRRLIKSEERNIKVFEYNDFLELKSLNSHPLYICHGIYCGANPIRKHILEVKGSVLFGHVHEIGCISFKSIKQTTVGYSNGCLTHIDSERQPKYLENKSHNWTQSITSITVDYWHYSVNIIPIYEGKILMATGEILS